MAKLVWDQTGEKTYETGIEQCALYVTDSITGTYCMTNRNCIKGEP